jgi:hypothetical protein
MEEDSITEGGWGEERGRKAEGVRGGGGKRQRTARSIVFTSVAQGEGLAAGCQQGTGTGRRLLLW